MKYFILPILLLLALSLPAFAEQTREIMPVRKIEANPINVAVMLTEQLDSAAMVATLTYYGYHPASDDSSLKTQDSRLKTFTHSNGSIIRFTFSYAEDGKKYPTIEVKSKDSQKEKDQRLQELNFKRNGNHYERRSIGYQTLCWSASNGYLRLSNQPKDKK